MQELHASTGALESGMQPVPFVTMSRNRHIGKASMRTPLRNDRQVHLRREQTNAQRESIETLLRSTEHASSTIPGRLRSLSDCTEESTHIRATAQTLEALWSRTEDAEQMPYPLMATDRSPSKSVA